MSEIDQNEILAKVAVDSMARAASVFSRSLDDARRTVSVKFGAGFARFKKASIARYGSVRTLLHRDKPIPLRALYVESRLEHDDEVITDDHLIEKISKPSRSLIVGTAGGGKSMLMRFINLVLSEAENGILPVFFELRSLNSTPGVGLIDAIVAHIAVHIPEVDVERFSSLINERRIVLILDGFDEIDYDQRERFALEISELSRKFPQITLIVSSRPDDLVGSIETFSIYRAIPFTKEQAIDLLGRLPYDEVVREKFISEVDKNLYEKHKDFLSNPLLVTMMLMTYHQFAEIPSKVHIFYQQAFETLFSWHDSSKDVFKRKSYTDLPIDEFQRVFSYFCASSYLAQSFTFSSTGIRQQLSSAISAERVEASTEFLLRDLLESTCLLQKEGLEIVFVHRSFQEYFTALFITRLDSSARKKAIDAAVRRAYADLVIPMAHEIAPAAVERSWSAPTAKALLRKLRISCEGDPLKELAVSFESLSFSKDRVSLHYDVSGTWGGRLLALDKLYELRITSLDKDKIEAAYDKFCERMQGADYRSKIQGISYYSAPVDPKEIPAIMYVRLAEPIREVFEDLGLGVWAGEVHKWLESIVSDMDARISTRKMSIDAMLSR